MAAIVVLGTLDTKGTELKYVRDILVTEGMSTLMLDAGVLGQPQVASDVTREEVARAGGKELDDLIDREDRGYAMTVMTRGAARLVRELHQQGRVQGIISLGGSAGTTIGTAAMRELPVGIPKVMVSTLASGNTRPYVGTRDICMMYSVLAIEGLNRVSRRILGNAARAVAGMVKGPQIEEEGREPLIATTTFGVTAPGVNKAREYLEQLGYEVLVFHATGTGGAAMEGLVRDRYINGVLDITTTELCDELVGGIFSAGRDRLEAAGKAGIPQVVSLGALDLVNFGSWDTVPYRFKGRRLYRHNPSVTLMRTEPHECARLGRVIAEKLNRATGPAALVMPLRGVSLIDRENQPFWHPEADQALFQAIRDHLSPGVQLIELDTDINNDQAALTMASLMDEMMRNQSNSRC